VKQAFVLVSFVLLNDIFTGLPKLSVKVLPENCIVSPPAPSCYMKAE